MASEKLYVTNPEKWLDDTAGGPDLLCLVIFRGSWCKYDKHYLQKLGQFCSSQTDTVQLIAWTSEGEAGAAQADTEWKLTTQYGYDKVIGDETNALAKWLIEDETLPHLEIVESSTVQDLPETVSYKHGMAMPAMVFYAHHGSPVFEWNKPFEAPDCGGPGRPLPADVWEQVSRRKHALDEGNAVMPSHGAKVRLCSTTSEVALSNCVIM